MWATTSSNTVREDYHTISAQDVSPYLVNKEAFGVNGENEGGDGVGIECCLSGNKDFFDVIMSKSHITRPHCLHMPKHILPKLPGVTMPLVLRHGDKQWETMYVGGNRKPRFDCGCWKTFVDDNNLAEGDACIFEVMESSTQILRFDVVILRNTMDLPPALVSKIQSNGKTPETAIEII
ncbi:B3 domain-containing protein REM16-like [Salvia hispanica]|uniref:B3 domain-containing protein REM16-like n=1 Tax=Salvia hispanica TaxID=49212 RepID=UPI0020093F5B|nr:B3 domain-containing protein REM16-like [Salvia hispanica]